MKNFPIQYHGTAGHFIDVRNCCFRMCSTVGNVRVSSVGCYHPDGNVNRNRPKEPVAPAAGADAYYETVVFRLDEDGAVEAGSGHRAVTDWTEVERFFTSTQSDAELLHATVCTQWSNPSWQEAKLRRKRMENK